MMKYLWPGSWGLGPWAWLGELGAWGISTEVQTQYKGGSWGLHPGAWGPGPGALGLAGGAWGMGSMPRSFKTYRSGSWGLDLGAWEKASDLESGGQCLKQYVSTFFKLHI